MKDFDGFNRLREIRFQNALGKKSTRKLELCWLQKGWHYRPQERKVAAVRTLTVPVSSLDKGEDADLSYYLLISYWFTGLLTNCLTVCLTYHPYLLTVLLTHFFTYSVTYYSLAYLHTYLRTHTYLHEVDAWFLQMPRHQLAALMPEAVCSTT